MKILITGGSGMVGSQLTKILKNKGIEVVWLSRTAGSKNGIQSFKWDYKAKFIDTNAFDGITHLVHLAGAGVFDKRWSLSYKKEIYESRIKTTELLADYLPKMQQLKAVICGTAIGIYGNSLQTIPLEENANNGTDFLAKTTVDWEKAADLFEMSGIRTVKIRTGIVLAKDIGALPAIIQPIKSYIGSPLASGEQIISWIHLEDLCNIFVKAIEDERMAGSYNGVAPAPVSNKVFTVTAAKILKKPLILPNVPSLALNIILGKEKADSVIKGISVSASKIQQEGFIFKYPTIDTALNNLLST